MKMSLLHEDNNVDYNRIIIKSLYFGMFVNILIPMAGIMLCYYADQNSWMENRVGDFSNSLFIVFAILSLLQAGYALWQKSKNFAHPMVRRVETMEQDLAEGLLKASKPIFLIIVAIAAYGFLYFYLTARFQETVFLVFFSFLVFQVVRPRLGIVRKLIDIQKALMKKGEFLRD